MPAVFRQSGFLQTVGRIGQRVLMQRTNLSDRGPDTGSSESFGVPHGTVLDASISVRDLQVQPVAVTLLGKNL